MLRNLTKVGHNLAKLSQLHRYGLTVINSSRHFSGDLIADWPESIKTFLEREKISKPTLIQEKTLPIAMNNKDLVGIARTGSGKTLAFVIPAVLKIMKEQENKGEAGRKGEKAPSCVIIAPTRELAAQTSDVFRKFNKFGIRSIVLVGGASRADQVRDLSYKDHDVYIATPGRLKDLVDTQVVDLSQVKYLVLDEADRMLDMGFEPQIRDLISHMPKERQTLMWSATWPREIQDLAEDFMTEYEKIAVDSESLKANPNIKQIVEVCQPREKLEKVLDYLADFTQELDKPRTLIFTNTKRMAEQIMMQLMRNKYRAISMHGDRSQAQRDNALRLFKNRSCNIMVATDVAARGLDIDDITHVINYDFPRNIEDYIHRIGRTARHEKKGTSVSLLTTDDASIVPSLVEVLRETQQEIPDRLHQLAKQRPSQSRQSNRSDYNNRSRYSSRSHFDRESFYEDREDYGSRSYGRSRTRQRSSLFDD